jgi:proline dehydrogenase
MEDADGMRDISLTLALQLIAMRDSLIRTSLALHDWQYAMDSEAKRLAQEATDGILKRHGCPPGIKGSGASS